MRLTAALLTAALTGQAALADDAPPLRAGLGGKAVPAVNKTPTADDAKKADDTKKPDEKKAEPKKAVPAATISGGTATTQIAAPVGTRADRLKAAITSYQAQCASWVERYQAAESDDDKKRMLQFLPAPTFAVQQAARLVLDDPKDDVSFDALAFIVKYADVPAVKAVLGRVPAAKRGDPAEKLDVTATLIEHHMGNPRLATVAASMQKLTPATTDFLVTLAEKAKSPEVRGQIGQSLADQLNRMSENAKASEADREKYLGTAEKVLSKLVADEEVAAVAVGKRTMGESLKGMLKEVSTLTIGKKFPDLVGESLDGTAVKAADYKGKVLVLDIWATWCGPCVAMIPHEREMVKHFKDKPFALVSVSCDAKKETVTTFLDKTPMPWTHWFDGQGGTVNKALGIRFFPTIYVIDAKGVIRFKNIRGKELEDAVEKLVAEVSVAPQR